MLDDRTGGALIPSTPPTARERAKDERRRRVVKAAARLLADRENGVFSMQELASHAGLSPATPYNLFGSKAAILGRVFRNEVEGLCQIYERDRARPPAERILVLADHLVSAFLRRPKFYKSLSSALSALAPGEFQRELFPVVEAMYGPFVAALRDDGALPAPIPVERITTHLVRIYSATFLHWATFDMAAEPLREELRYGFIITFLGLMDEAGRTALLQALRSPAPSGL